MRDFPCYFETLTLAQINIAIARLLAGGRWFEIRPSQLENRFVVYVHADDRLIVREAARA